VPCYSGSFQPKWFLLWFGLANASNEIQMCVHLRNSRAVAGRAISGTSGESLLNWIVSVRLAFAGAKLMVETRVLLPTPSGLLLIGVIM